MVYIPMPIIPGFTGVTETYMKPMLRGAQIGEHVNSGVTTACARYCNDCNWNTISGFTVGASASSFDTANGWLTLADATSIYPTGLSMSTGHYAFLLKRSTGATDVFNCTIANNAITTTAAGVTTIGGTAYTGTALTSPVWLEFVATGTQIAVYSNGVLIGTKTGLTLAASNISMSRTTANIYVLAMNFNALESTSTNGVAVTIGGIPHGARGALWDGTFSGIEYAYMERTISSMGLLGQYFAGPYSVTTYAAATGHVLDTVVNITEAKSLSLESDDYSAGHYVHPAVTWGVPTRKAYGFDLLKASKTVRFLVMRDMVGAGVDVTWHNPATFVDGFWFRKRDSP